jgi:hypothetical protein
VSIAAFAFRPCAGAAKARRWRLHLEQRVTDYWLSKLFFDLQDSARAAAYRANRAQILADYPLSPEALAGLATDDVAFFLPRVNAYLLRYYFQTIGVKDAEFMRRLHALSTSAEPVRG